MMATNVKNTILSGLGELLAPHYCCSCGEIGSLLCVHCKYDIINESSMFCLVCKQPTDKQALCGKCEASYLRTWTIGEKSRVLERMIFAFKFERVGGFYAPLAELMAEKIGQLPDNTVIVPVPTVASHIRQRGYDHSLLIAKELARINNVKVKTLVKRQTNTVQRGASFKQRKAQASEAFCVPTRVDSDKIYLIVDDVCTTGSTLEYTAVALRKAGAEQIWAAVAMYQPK